MQFECNICKIPEHSQEYLYQCFDKKFTHIVVLYILGNVRKKLLLTENFLTLPMIHKTTVCLNF